MQDTRYKIRNKCISFYLQSKEQCLQISNTQYAIRNTFISRGWVLTITVLSIGY